MTHRVPPPNPDPLDLVVKGILYVTPRIMTLLGAGLLTWFLYGVLP